MPGIHPDITTAFGNTPLVRLNALTEGLGAEVLAKLEFYNPGSAVKDRLGSRSSRPPRRPVSCTPAARSSSPRAATPASRSRWSARPRLQGHPHDALVDVEGAPHAAEGVRRRARADRPYKGMTEAVDAAKQIVGRHPGRDLAPPVRERGERGDPPPDDGGGDLERHRRRRSDMVRRRRRARVGRSPASARCSRSASPTWRSSPSSRRTPPC